MIFPFLGMPPASSCVTHQVYDWFSKASFEDALVDIDPLETEISINLVRHINKLFGRSEGK